MKDNMDILSLMESLGGMPSENKKEKTEGDTAKKKDLKEGENTADHKPKDKNASQTANKSSVKLSDQVTCIGKNFRLTLSGVSCIDDCVKQLYDLGYKEILLSGQCVLVNQSTLLFQLSDRAVQDSVHAIMPMCVCAGDKRMELEAEDFPELDPDEISILDVHDRWVAIHPEDEKCSLCYDPKYGVATPCFSESALNKQQNVELPVKVSIFGSVATVTQEDLGIISIPTCESLCDYISEAYSVKFQGVDLVLYNSKGMLVLGCITKKKPQSIDCKAYQVDGNAGIVNVKEKYPLPFTLCMANFNISTLLTSEDFGGKIKVDLEEVMEYVKQLYPMFRSPDRKADIYYLKDRNILSVAAMSGKKGVAG